VGPVAVASLMTASAIGAVTEAGIADPISAAIMLALLGGLLMMTLGFLKMGFVANFLSHSVVSGFITASGILIAVSQLKHLFGIPLHGDSLPELLSGVTAEWDSVHLTTLFLGSAVLTFLIFCRSGLCLILIRLGCSARYAAMMSKAAPMFAVIVTIIVSQQHDLASVGVSVVGEIPSGLPAFNAPVLSLELMSALLVPAFVIALIGFVESVSVGRTLGAKRRERISEDRELLGLGAANIASAVSGGFPVTGGFSRSVVNFDAGAQTQMASVFTAFGIALVALYLTPALYHLPHATLAATIIIAVTGLINFKDITAARALSRADFATITLTILATLIFGVEAGVAGGIACSIGLHLYKTSVPHVAEVGLVEGTEHYRNVNRHKVITHPGILSLRVDESLYFANAGFLETHVENKIAETEKVTDVILMCSAVNEIDVTALHALENINLALKSRGARLHLSEVKGPVMDKLATTDFLSSLTGDVFLTHHKAVSEVLT
ncbi:MAG: SulP family inorganic anion transporter, partial [Halieaceae bacterium]